jgi:hypothetical protein
MLWNTFDCEHYLNEDLFWLHFMQLGMQAMSPWRLTLHTPKKTLEVDGNTCLDDHIPYFQVQKNKSSSPF